MKNNDDQGEDEDDDAGADADFFVWFDSKSHN